MLYRWARLPGLTGHRALLTVDDRIAGVRPDADATADLPSGTQVADLDGALVLPGFVDAHVHVTETGLLLDGVDLTGARSAAHVLDLVASAASSTPGRPVLGHGWDELALGGRVPTGAELDRAAGGAVVYLSRVDVHSALVSDALARAAGLRDLPGWDGTGRVERDAHHAARRATRYGIPSGQRRRVQELALRAAVAAGVTRVHEMSAPHVAPVEDLADLVSLTRPDGTPGGLPAVVPYRGTLAADADDARRIAGDLREAGVRVAGLAGDLMVDGSFGSRTAALDADYTDRPGHRGHLYLDAGQVRDHVVACTLAGLQAGFHAIGDAAVDAAVAGFETAAAQLGEPAVRAARHRLEHAEAIGEAGVRTLARLGVVIGVQPPFDAAWGGPGGMYAVRLGAERAAALNPFATMAAAGVELQFGSDSPVTPISPWAAIGAALMHHTEEQRLGLRAAVDAHLGGRPAGSLRPGSNATFACWRLPQPPDDGDDPLDAVGRLLTGSDLLPVCTLTVIDGAPVFP